MMARLCMIALTACALFAQTGFEAVSIRPGEASRPGWAIHGGPGSSDPGLVTMRNIDLFSFVAMAWGLHRYQVSAPDWLNSTRFDISARIPSGVDADQYRRMLQSMLAERFHLAVHRESREMRIYYLSVAKNGPKIKKSPNPSAAAGGLQPPPPRATPPPGYHGPVMINNPALSMPRLAAFLSGFLDAPVDDATGLEGDFDVHLRTLASALSPGAISGNAPQSLFDALPEQLGLRLASGKNQADILVVDGMERSPSAN
jgi:uncharacterized protein (TIGR03435 family)